MVFYKSVRTLVFICRSLYGTALIFLQESCLTCKIKYTKYNTILISLVESCEHWSLLRCFDLLFVKHLREFERFFNFINFGSDFFTRIFYFRKKIEFLILVFWQWKHELYSKHFWFWSFICLKHQQESAV